MAPPPASTDQVGAMATTLPFASLPAAENCCVAVTGSVTGFGVTTTDASAPGSTVTVAVPLSPRLLAWTELAKVPAVVPAVNRPEPLMAPPLATTDHVGVNCTTFPDASLPTAVYCCVPPMASVCGVGVTVMVASGPTVTVTVAEAL